MSYEKTRKRKKRHARIRNRLMGMPDRPRISLFRTTKHIYVQLIDDLNGKTLAHASSLDKELKGKIKHGGNLEAAVLVGELFSKRILETSIREVVFDRGGFRYTGCVKALADKVREAGIKF